MAELDFAALLELLKEKDLNPCPACGNHGWLATDEPVFVPLLGEGEIPGFRAIPLFCSNCGLMHLHNFAALETDPEVMERAIKENQKADDSS